MNILNHCAFCGRYDIAAHKKYTDRCVDCGKTYTKYSNYKSLQKSKPTMKRQALLDRIIEDYKIAKRAGLNVPRDIE